MSTIPTIPGPTKPRPQNIPKAPVVNIIMAEAYVMAEWKQPYFSDKSEIEFGEDSANLKRLPETTFSHVVLPRKDLTPGKKYWIRVRGVNKFGGEWSLPTPIVVPMPTAVPTPAVTPPTVAPTPIPTPPPAAAQPPAIEPEPTRATRRPATTPAIQSRRGLRIALIVLLCAILIAIGFWAVYAICTHKPSRTPSQIADHISDTASTSPAEMTVIIRDNNQPTIFVGQKLIVTKPETVQQTPVPPKALPPALPAPSAPAVSYVPPPLLQAPPPQLMVIPAGSTYFENLQPQPQSYVRSISFFGNWFPFVGFSFGNDGYYGGYYGGGWHRNDWHHGGGWHQNSSNNGHENHGGNHNSGHDYGHENHGGNHNSGGHNGGGHGGH
jgi:hypothetical protein